MVAIDGSLVLQGKWSFVDTVGLRTEAMFVDGLRDGKWTYRRPDGSVAQTTEFSKDQTHGKQVEYAENGALHAERSFEQGALHGPSTIHLADGSLRIEEWNHGERVSVREVPAPAASASAK
jgi:antitoxin component YwqK of YwqJK toxin-antitoxin module